MLPRPSLLFQWFKVSEETTFALRLNFHFISVRFMCNLIRSTYAKLLSPYFWALWY
jgi:hypothetical protein